MLCSIISRKVKTQLKRKKKICAVCGEGAMTDQTCQKWFVKFHAGDFLLDDAPQSGRQVEVDRDQIETLIENNKHYTMLEIVYNTENIQTTKVTGENKKMRFSFYGKN